MVFDERPSPARVSAAAAAKLPRAALLALIVAYIVSGLFGRDPWQEDDATGFGIMWTMAHGGEWLLPAVAGERVAADGPLAFWAGAASIAAFGPALGDLTASRLPTVLWFFVATGALWYAVLRLARRDEAQPVAFAFGGEATSRDYGRMLADVAVLLVLATAGPIVSLHETTSAPAAFALSSLAIFGLALSLERPVAGPLLAGGALGLLVLARGAQPALWLTLAALPLAAGTLARPVRQRALVLLLLAGGGVVGGWVAAVLAGHGDAGRSYLADWAASSLRGFALPTGDSLAWLLRALAWQTWPLWPLAAWALYAWRQGLRRPHMAFGSLLLVTGIFGLLSTRAPSSEDVVHVILPLVLLAAFGAVSLRRAAENAIDWFAITAFCLATVALWTYFFAMHAGVPPKMSRSVLRLTAEYVPPLDWAAVAIAAAASAVWFALVAWRVRQPSGGALWRGPALAASGMVALWVAFSALFLGAVDHRRSFAGLASSAAAEIARAAPADACVLAHHLRPSHRAVFAFHGGIRFASGDDDDCPLALHRDLAGSLLDDGLPAGRWTELWQGHRPGRPDEAIRLYRRAGD
jgi:4-amino-4-deoxy-L-arabinose transferase-like glycosyltransferase